VTNQTLAPVLLPGLSPDDAECGLSLLKGNGSRLQEKMISKAVYPSGYSNIVLIFN